MNFILLCLGFCNSDFFGKSGISPFDFLCVTPDIIPLILNIKKFRRFARYYIIKSLVFRLENGLLIVKLDNQPFEFSFLIVKGWNFPNSHFMGRNGLSQPGDVFLKSYLFAFNWVNFVFEIPNEIVSAFDLSLHTEDDFFKLTNSVQQWLTLSESTGTTGLVKTAIVNFFYGRFVELAFVVQGVDDGAFGVSHGEIVDDTVLKSFDFCKVLFAPEFHLFDVALGFFEVFDDAMVFFDEFVDFDSRLIKLNDGLGLVGDEFGFDMLDILEEGFALVFELFDSEFDFFDVLGMSGDEDLLKIAELGVFVGESADLRLEFWVEIVETDNFWVDDGDFVFEEGDLLEVGVDFVFIFLGFCGVMLISCVDEMFELFLPGEEGVSLFSEGVDGVVEFV